MSKPVSFSVVTKASVSPTQLYALFPGGRRGVEHPLGAATRRQDAEVVDARAIAPEGQTRAVRRPDGRALGATLERQAARLLGREVDDPEIGLPLRSPLTAGKDEAAAVR